MPVISVYVNNETFGKFVSKDTEEQKKIREDVVSLIERKVK